MIREGKLQGVGQPSLKDSENRRTIKVEIQKEGMNMKLVFVRHGESEWNALNLFTGWSDVELTQKGEQEAHHAGKVLRSLGIQFNHVYLSVLKRAIHTGHIVLSELNQDYLPETKIWRLNERHYGALQGLNKQETREKYGDEQVLLWRRSYDVMPPLLSEEEAAKQAQDPRYKHLQVKDLPQGETLKTTLERVLPIWQDKIAVDLLDGKNVLVVAHGNSLRSLVKYLLNLSEDEILKFEIPTGTPLVFDLDENLQVKEYHFEK